MRRRNATAAIVLAGALCIARAWAQPSAEPVRLAYDAPTECPSASAFFDEITARTPKVRRPGPGEEARTLRVRLARVGDVFSGSLTFEEGSSGTTPRRVEGSSCAEVASALGLIAALAVDPAARTDANAGAGGDASAGAGGDASAGAGGDASAGAGGDASAGAGASAGGDAGARAGAGAGGDAGARASAGAGGDDASAGAGASAAGDEAWRVGAGVQVGASSAVEIAPLLRAHVTLERDGDGWAPSARLSFARTAGMRLETAGVGALVALSAARAEGCPVAWALDGRRRLLVRPCAALDVGWIEGEGRNVALPQSRTRPWIAAGGLARLGWSPTRWLVLEAQLAVIAPFFRESFVLDAGTEVFRAPVVAGEGGLGFSLRIP